MRECEIGSEAWMRERIEHGLDPGEGDRPRADSLLRFEVELAGPADRQPEPSWAWGTSNTLISHRF